MTAITYPSSLPRPSVATIKASERRLLTSLVGPRAARTLRDVVIYDADKTTQP